MGVVGLLLAVVLQVQPPAVVELVVTSTEGPVPRAQVIAGGKTVETARDGRVVIDVPPGSIEITVVKAGFNPVTIHRYSNAGPAAGRTGDARAAERDRTARDGVSDPHEQAHRGPADARRSRRRRRDPGKADDDPWRHRHDAERDRGCGSRRRRPPSARQACAFRGCAAATRAFSLMGCRCSVRTSAASDCCRFHRRTSVRSK
jgi:hypothetical protein